MASSSPCKPGTASSTSNEKIHEDRAAFPARKPLTPPLTDRRTGIERGRQDLLEKPLPDTADYSIGLAAALGREIDGRTLGPDLPVELFFEFGAVPQNPQIEISMAAARKLRKDIPFPNDFDHRRKDGVVPVSDRFFKRDFTLLIEPHEIVVHFDVLHQIGVGSRRSDGDVGVRSQKIEPRAFQKIGELGFEDEVFWLNVRRKWHPGLHIRDVGLDVRVTLCRATDTRWLPSFTK